MYRLDFAAFRRCRCKQRNGKTKSRALPRHAFDPHLPAHELDESFADGQAESCAAVLARGRTFSLAEGLEKPMQPFRANSDSRIPHGELEFHPLAARRRVTPGGRGDRP